MTKTILKSSIEKLAFILDTYRKDPVKFFRDVLNVNLDEQQVQLVLEATKLGSRVMVKSARGTGKTFIITGLTIYFLICFKGVNIRILSPSEQQLKTVFMREITKHKLNMNPLFKDYIDIRSMSIHNTQPGMELNVAHCITASVERPENVSGVHETGEGTKQIYMLDEASAIPDTIYSAITGSLGTAEGGGHIIGVSNPNRGKQVFYSNLFEKRPKGWVLLTFTAEKCAMIPKKFIEDQRELYGEDGDEYRVSVLGEFPRADSSVFIPESLVEDAENRVASYREYCHEPIIIGVDIARSLSGDNTVFAVRQGIKVLEIVAFKTNDTMETIAKLMDCIAHHKPNVVYGDATGVGGPVLDRAREIFRDRGINIPIVDVVVANVSTDPTQYRNVRAQLWGEMRAWLVNADIPSHYVLKKELSSMTWGYTGKMQIQLTAKAQLKAKGIDSSDHADALALTLYNTMVTARRHVVAPRTIKRTNYLWV